MKKKIQCPFCLQKFSIEFFIDDGDHQELIQDCEICCHPIEINITFDFETNTPIIEVQKSTGF